jgi:hypothetical protein
MVAGNRTRSPETVRVTRARLNVEARTNGSRGVERRGPRLGGAAERSAAGTVRGGYNADSTILTARVGRPTYLDRSNATRRSRLCASWGAAETT